MASFHIASKLTKKIKSHIKGNKFATQLLTTDYLSKSSNNDHLLISQKLEYSAAVIPNEIPFTLLFQSLSQTHLCTVSKESIMHDQLKSLR